MAASEDTAEDRNLRVMARWRQTGRVLIEALPYILKYDQKTIVVKYGGNAMTGGGTDDFSQDIVLMKQTGIDPVVVHGGGPQIGAMLKKLDIQSRFIDGLRVTDEAAVEVVEMVLTGSINKQIVTAINAAGGRAVGLSGKDGNLVVARKLALTKTDSVTGKTTVEDLGFVGEPDRVNPEVLYTMLKKLNIESRFIDGLRVTDEAAVEVVEMVLTGSINKHIVTAINAAGGRAVGLSGKDGNMVMAKKLALTRTDPVTGKVTVEDLGFVGEPERVNPEILHTMMKSEIIPVIAPIGVGPKGETYNINADTVAGAVASAVKAERLVLLTDVEGVLDKDKKLIAHLTVSEARALIANGTISGGMIPKISTAIEAVEAGVHAAVILDGRIPHVLLLELFTEHGAGTLITAG